MAHAPKHKSKEEFLLLHREVDIILEPALVKIGSAPAHSQARVAPHAAVVELGSNSNSAVHRPLLSLI